jgi:hypothetical protein
MNDRDQAEEEIAACLNAHRLEEPSETLRTSILADAQREWESAPTSELRERILAAAKSEWESDVDTDSSNSWIKPFMYLAASLAAAFVLVAGANSANRRTLAKWQNPSVKPVPSTVTMMAANRDASMPMLATIVQPGSSQDLVDHLRRAHNLLRKTNGDKI